MTNWHIITCEYPPQVGGVSDYTRLLAHQLRAAGNEVHIWAPQCDAAEEPGVHRVLGNFSSRDLRQAGELLDRQSGPRMLLVQWVPHGYGKRGVNIGFSRWIASRVRSGDGLSLMVHEPYLEPGQSSWKLRFVSLAQRRMIRRLLYASSRVFISIPAWENYLRPYKPPLLACEWLPIPATVETSANPQAVCAIRAQFGNDALVLGHLGTYSAESCRILQPALLQVLGLNLKKHALLLGSNSDRFARELQSAAPELASRIHGTGLLPDTELSHHISACDLALQPYIDGLSSRRTSLMNIISRGVPVVSNTGHLTEQLWSESHAVALASTTEATQLASLCSRLLRDDAARRELALAGRILYTSQFDWPNIIATLRSSPEAAQSAAASTSSNRSGA